MSGLAAPRNEQPVADATPKKTWVDHIEGTLPANDLRRAFVAGARWYLMATDGVTMFSDEREAAEAAAEARYPGGRPPNVSVTDATHECILAIAVDRLTRAAQWDGYVRAMLDDYRRLQAQDIGSRIIATGNAECPKP